MLGIDDCVAFDVAAVCSGFLYAVSVADSMLRTGAAKHALVIGSEGNGVAEAVAEQCERFRLTMRGHAESINASVAAGVLLFVVSEAMPHER